MQAKDVDDRDFLAAVLKFQLLRQQRYLHGDDWLLSDLAASYYRDHLPSALRREVEQELSLVPWKVLLAKARSLIRRGLLNGCACGCRGDYEVTEAGHAVLA